MRSLILGGLAAASLFFAAYEMARPGDDPALHAPTSRATSTQQVHELGREIYNFRCYFCHGYSGDARTLAATYLDSVPRDFTAPEAAALNASSIAATVRDGRTGTAMKAFRGILDEAQIDAVAAFVEREFVQHKAPNTRYHTAANGWPDHDRHAAAYPFARGEIALDAPIEQLSESQQSGRRLFMGTCISCHDRARVDDEGPAWSARPVSYPRFGFVPGQPNVAPVDAVSSASVYAKHEVRPVLADLTPLQRHGESLYHANCAFCHGGDGSGKNWIGQFMQPKARDLTQYTVLTLPGPRLTQVIREGLPGTSMPAWQSVLQPGEIDAIAAYVARAFYQPVASGQ